MKENWKVLNSNIQQDYRDMLEEEEALKGLDQLRCVEANQEVGFLLQELDRLETEKCLNNKVFKHENKLIETPAIGIETSSLE